MRAVSAARSTGESGASASIALCSIKAPAHGQDAVPSATIGCSLDEGWRRPADGHAGRGWKRGWPRTGQFGQHRIQQLHLLLLTHDDEEFGVLMIIHDEFGLVPEEGRRRILSQ